MQARAKSVKFFAVEFERQMFDAGVCFLGLMAAQYAFLLGLSVDFFAK